MAWVSGFTHVFYTIYVHELIFFLKLLSQMHLIQVYGLLLTLYYCWYLTRMPLFSDCLVGGLARGEVVKRIYL